MTQSINEYRAGVKVGARSEFLAIGDVIPGHEDALRQTLARHMADPRTQQAVLQIGTLHEARFVLLDGGKRLMFASSFDGPWDVYIDDFATTDIGRNFDETWEHVQGYPGVTSPNIKEWFKDAHDRGGQLRCRLSRTNGPADLEGAGRAEGVPAGARHPRGRGGAPAPGAQAPA